MIERLTKKQIEKIRWLRNERENHRKNREQEQPILLTKTSPYNFYVLFYECKKPIPYSPKKRYDPSPKTQNDEREERKDLPIENNKKYSLLRQNPKK